MAELDHIARGELASQLTRVPEARTLIDALFTPSDLPSLASDRRRLGVPAESYADIIHEIELALPRACRFNSVDLAPEEIRALNEQAAAGLREMAEAARDADLAGVPPATAAQVTGVLPLFVPAEAGTAATAPGWAVYLEAPAPVEYLPGQSLPVLRPDAPVDPHGDQLWDELAPALPSNEFGQLVFFLLPGATAPGAEAAAPLAAAAAGAASVRVPRVGEFWTLGHPRGEEIDLTLPPGETAGTFTVDATGSRLPGARAAVFGLVGEPTHDRKVELYVDAVGANEPGLRSLAETADWLSLTLF